MSILTPFFNLIKPAKTDPQAVAQLNSNFDTIDTEMHKPPLTVNGISPDSATRDLTLQEVPLAANLTSDEAQNSFGTYVERSTGGAASISNGNAWLVTIKGNSVKTGYVAESLQMTVSPAERSGDVPITATIDRDTFVSYVSISGTTTLTYTTSWSADPTLYGITVTGTPINGDVITVVYVKENRGTISSTTPTSFNSTGWNLYNNSTGYARVVNYSEEYGLCVTGTYSSLEFAETVNGSRTSITPVDGFFSVPSDGYVFVSGGNSTDTAIFMTWSDWVDPDNRPSFAAYSVSTISIADIMVSFPIGLLSVGAVRDEINLNAQKAISRIQRLNYTAENLAAVIASGVAYDTDTSFIYAVRESYVMFDISVSGDYTASDHGIEFLAGTSVPAEIETLYGQDLKNKLRRDVLTISAQALTSGQQAQARTNIGAASASDVATITSQLLHLNKTNVDGTERQLIIKTGDKNVSHSTATGVTFDEAFPNGCLFVDAVCNQSAYSATTGIAVYNLAKTGFTIFQKNTASAAMTVKWIAIGY